MTGARAALCDLQMAEADACARGGAGEGGVGCWGGRGGGG